MENKLISMTDFVLQNKMNIKGYESDAYGAFCYNHLVKIETYAEFLKRNLQLGFFVPCDENGNVLQEPRMIARTIGFDEQDVFWDIDEVEAYRKAKEKVLFKGVWRVTNYKGWNLVEGGNYSFSFYPFESDCLTIENLIDRDLELTESALKQIKE